MFEHSLPEHPAASSKSTLVPTCPGCLQQGRARPNADPQFVRHFRCIRCGMSWRSSVTACVALLIATAHSTDGDRAGAARFRR